MDVDGRGESRGARKGSGMVRRRRLVVRAEWKRLGKKQQRRRESRRMFVVELVKNWDSDGRDECLAADSDGSSSSSAGEIAGLLMSSSS